MKTKVILAIMGLALGSSHAQTVPLFINYQGYVTDVSGAPLGAAAPVNRKVLFRIWNHATLTVEANRLWSEEQTVTIALGQFSVLLGQGNDAVLEGRPRLSAGG